MEKKILSAGVLFFCIALNAQLMYVGESALVRVNDNTLLYGKGGLKVVSNGEVNNSGNIMLVADPSATSNKFETVSPSNFVLKYTDATNYGQFYTSGFAQSDLTGELSKEFKEASHGAYQQMALPFYDKSLNTLSTELGKVFKDQRYSQDEILIWNNESAVAQNVSINSKTTKATPYYILGGKGVDFNKVGAAYVLKGRPIEDAQTETLEKGGPASFGSGGSGRNQYGEEYKTYIQDPFRGVAWSTSDYGKNMYQYGNPYLTNLDLNDIGLNTSNSDDVFINNLVGIIAQPSAGNVKFSTKTGSSDTTPNITTFASGAWAGDPPSLVKPLQTFTVKLSSATAATLNFDKLRTFRNAIRPTGTPYTVTARSSSTGNTVKQLGVIALDEDGLEMGRTYYVVYNNAVSGYNDAFSTQATGSQGNVIGSFEEDPVQGGVDSNYANKYWLYINEANEQTFKGKAIPVGLYNENIKSLKFEIRENTNLLESGRKELSTGVGFYYKAASGKLEEVAQDMVIPVTASTYSLFYGKEDSVLGTSSSVKPSRTKIVYNPAIDNYIVRFDSNWKKADIQVYDTSGKLVLSKENVSPDQDFILPISQGNRAYIVTAISEKGEKAVAKIIR